MPEAEAKRSALPEPPLGSPALFAVVLAASSLLSAAMVWTGTGLQDGFGSAWLQILAQRLLRQQLWLLPLACASGVLLRRYYAALLRPVAKDLTTGALVALAVVRAFTHFPLYGFIALFGAMAGMAVAGARWLRDRARRLESAPGPGETARGLIETWLAVPIWFILLPMSVLKLENEGDLELPVTVPRRKLLRMFVVACVLLALWTNMVSEDTGERTDPLWLTAVGAFWLGDFLLGALRVVPILRARRGLPP